MKLKEWIRGSEYALDLEVAAIPQTAIRELCIADGFGFDCGMRLAFFEDTMSEPDGQIWVVGSRRDDEPLSEHMLEMLNYRVELIEDQN